MGLVQLCGFTPILDDSTATTVSLRGRRNLLKPWLKFLKVVVVIDRIKSKGSESVASCNIALKRVRFDGSRLVLLKRFATPIWFVCCHCSHH